MRSLLLIVVLVVGCSAALGQETQSVLINPPPAQQVEMQQVMPAPMPVPQVSYVLQRGFFGVWRLRPVYPVEIMVVRPAPRPTVIWTPSVIWR